MAAIAQQSLAFARVLLQGDLYRATFDRTESGDLEQIADEAFDFKLVADLKSTVEYMRHLWACIEAIAKADSAKMDQALQASRMNRATEVLRVAPASQIVSAKNNRSILETPRSSSRCHPWSMQASKTATKQALTAPHYPR